MRILQIGWEIATASPKSQEDFLKIREAVSLRQIMATAGIDIPDINIEVPDGFEDSVVVEETIVEGVKTVDVTIEKTLDGGAVTVESGTTTSISSDKKVKNTDVVASVEAGETTAVSFNTKNVKGSAIRIKGEGAGDVSFEGETRVKGTKIKFKAESADSVSFADGTLVKNVKVNMGGGDDTITFGDVKLKGKNVVKLGDGNDTLEISSDTKVKKDGKIVVKDFEEGDTIKLDGEAIDVNSTDVPDFLVIKGLD